VFRNLLAPKLLGLISTKMLKASLVLALSIGSPYAEASELNFNEVQLAGLKLGMTSQQAQAVLRASHPGATIHTFHTVCLRDYLAALKAGSGQADARCISGITVDFDMQAINVGLVEDLSGNRFGTTVITEIAIFDNRLRSQADLVAFRKHAIERFGEADYAPGLESLYSTWCSGQVKVTCNANDDVGGLSDFQLKVAPNSTPYGYDTDTSAPRYDFTIGVHAYVPGHV